MPYSIPIKRRLAFAPETKAFITANGEKLYSLKDLLEALERMDEPTFRYHVNSKKNDFQNWIREVLYDKRLARALRWTTTRETTIKKINEHLEKYYA